MKSERVVFAIPKGSDIVEGLLIVIADDDRADARVGREPGQVREEAAINGPGFVPSKPGRLPP